VTPLGHAIIKGNEAMAKFLLSEGAEVDCCDSRRQTHLFYAVRCCDVSMVKLLLQHGATLDAIDSEGCTPLLWAIDPLSSKSHSMPPNTAEIAFPVQSGLKRLEQWQKKTLPIVVLLLLDAGAAIDHRDHNGRSPLSHAAQRRYDQVIQSIVQPWIERQPEGPKRPYSIFLGCGRILESSVASTHVQFIRDCNPKRSTG
jgi:ankyrin repeat protein